MAVPPTAPSFRPVPLGVHQFSPMPGTGMLNPSYPNPGVQPPGVSSVPAPAPGMASGVTGAVPVPAPQQMMAYQVPPGQVPNPAMRPYATMPNGFAAATPQGAFLPPGGFSLSLLFEHFNWQCDSVIILTSFFNLYDCRCVICNFV